MIDQNLVENTTRTSDGEKKQQAHTEQELFGVCCSISDDALVLHAAEMTVKLDSPSAGKLFSIDSREWHNVGSIPNKSSGFWLVPNRTSCSRAIFKPGQVEADEESTGEPTAKRARVEANGDASTNESQDLMAEVENFASILSATLEDEI